MAEGFAQPSKVESMRRELLVQGVLVQRFGAEGVSFLVLEAGEFDLVSTEESLYSKLDLPVGEQQKGKTPRSAFMLQPEKLRLSSGVLRAVVSFITKKGSQSKRYPKNSFFQDDASH
jgi:hypothetical protein